MREKIFIADQNVCTLPIMTFNAYSKCRSCTNVLTNFKTSFPVAIG